MHWLQMRSRGHRHCTLLRGLLKQPGRFPGRRPADHSTNWLLEGSSVAIEGCQGLKVAQCARG